MTQARSRILDLRSRTLDLRFCILYIRIKKRNRATQFLMLISRTILVDSIAKQAIFFTLGLGTLGECRVIYRLRSLRPLATQNLARFLALATLGCLWGLQEKWISVERLGDFFEVLKSVFTLLKNAVWCRRNRYQKWNLGYTMKT